MAAITPTELEQITEKKVELLKEFLAMEPPKCKGDDLIEHWQKLYCDDMKKSVITCVNGESNDDDNRVFPYEKIRAIVGDGGNWKWPRMWQKLDEIERRGVAFREGEIINFQKINKNPEIISKNCLVVGGGPIGMRMAIELRMGGHKVTMIEKRREIRDAAGELTQLGFTNRINRPHMWAYVRNDLEKFNGKDFMSRQAAYPVFTEPDTSSIGIDELQLLLLKNVLLMGVDVRLGVGYNDSAVVQDKVTCEPRWQCELSYDEIASKAYGKPAGTNTEIFDCLIGCDGPRSTVRDKQAKYFGNIEKRKFMDCVGIVANVQKLSRKRLKELDYPHAQEPNDMNRTKMVFADFFAKLQSEANAEVQNFIYYKASFHNYIIVTPTRKNLIENGLSGKVYHFAAARGAAAAEMAKEKGKLREYMFKVLKAAGIPVDPEMGNSGFVDPPNDCMAFDFAECWNTKKSLSFSLAPPDYDVGEHGAWCGNKLTPVIALAGDSLLEPFWPLGLGLKRGWQAIMDTCYVVDNLYNRTMYCEELAANPDEFSWDMHWEKLAETASENFESCNRVEVAKEIGAGEYEPAGVVMLQWKKHASEGENPTYLVEVDPATRYKNKNIKLIATMKRKVLDDKKWVHPVVLRALNIIDYTEKCKKDVNYNGWKKLKTYGGRVIGEKPKSGYTFKAPGAAKKTAIPVAAIAAKAEEKRESLIAKVTANQIEEHITAPSQKRKSQMMGAQAGLLAQLKLNQDKGGTGGQSQADLHDLAYTPPESDSIAEQGQAMWDRSLEQGLTPGQTAELAHVRNQITQLQASIEGFRKAEKDILMGAKK